ncbi:MAG: bifunctional folylpolyglutamate synthase/dihydrofolate synthase [Phascolarctobacterium sp.]|nr:bifunctional folylpolyglutamate synthase/dihydrofolate synthase [Phascolarctobacterium sp.]
MNYNETLGYLENLGKFGIKLGMERIECLLKRLGNPERKIKTVHVTGTNGKGSVTSMIIDILLAADLKAGKFISPHLLKYNERISVSGQDISDADFAAIITSVKEAADNIVENGLCGQPTQFEVLTAAAFLYFHLCNVDYAVIEVGMGGLWDSTNVITPVVSVITNVALDHTDRCGATVSSIAMQKAGIIKEKVPLVTAAEGDEALGPIVSMAMCKGAPVYLYGKAFYGTEEESTIDGQIFTLHAGDSYNSEYKIRMPGAHQIKNASLAIVAAKLLSKQDARVDETALHTGIANTLWAGRLERICRTPDVILDGAHNPDGAVALRNALDKYYPGQSIVFIFGMMHDKDIDGVIKTLIKFKDIVYTVRVGNAGSRAATAEMLADSIGKQATATERLGAAFKSAVAAAGTNGVVCVCGSLYLVGEFKTMLLQEKKQCY